MFVVSRSTRPDGFRDSALSPIANAYTAYLRDRGYSDNTIPGYRNSVAHFAHWLTREDIELADIDDALVCKFVKVHLRVCDCVGRFQHSRETVQPALGHLLRVLRSKGCIRARAASLASDVQEELNRFDAHLDRVCGLAPATRTTRLYYVRAFLESRPVSRSAVGTRFQPRDIRQFVSHHSEQGQLGAVKVICSALRSYLRFRALCGERTETLIAAVPTVAQWRLASLPKTLAPVEIQQFLSVFDRSTSQEEKAAAWICCHCRWKPAGRLFNIFATAGQTDQAAHSLFGTELPSMRPSPQKSCVGPCVAPMPEQAFPSPGLALTPFDTAPPAVSFRPEPH